MTHPIAPVLDHYLAAPMELVKEVHAQLPAILKVAEHLTPVEDLLDFQQQITEIHDRLMLLVAASELILKATPPGIDLLTAATVEAQREFLKLKSAALREEEYFATAAQMSQAQDQIAALELALSAMQDQINEILEDLLRKVDREEFETKVQELLTRIQEIEDWIGPSLGSTNQRITELIDRLTNGEFTEALAQAVQSLETQVQETRDGLLAQSQELTALHAEVTDLDNRVAGTSDAVNQLTARVETGEGRVDSLAQSLNQLGTSVEDLATGQSANSTALQSLESRTTVNEGTVSTHEQALTQLTGRIQDAELGNDLQNQAIDSLETRMTSSESGQTVLVNDLSQLSARVLDTETGLQASGNALDLLTVRVEQAEDSLTIASEDLTQLTAGLGYGGNLLVNAGFEADTYGWGFVSKGQGWLATQLQRNLDNAQPAETNALSVTATGVPSGVLGVRSVRIPLEEGKRYLLSGQMAAENCRVRLEWRTLDPEGNELDFGFVGETTQGPSPRLGDWERFHGELLAPMDGTSFELQWWIDQCHTDSPKAWLLRPMVEETAVGQLGPSPWVPGSAGTDAKYAEATSLLSARIEEAEGTLSVLAQDLVALKTEVEDIGTSEAFTELSARVEVAEDSIELINDALTSLESTLDGKASTEAVDALGTRITETEDGLTTLVEDFNNLSSQVQDPETGLATRASSTELSQVATDLDTVTGTVTSHGQQLGQLGTRLDDAETEQASQAGALQSLETEVSNQGGELSALTSSVTGLTSQVTDLETGQSNTASALESLNTEVEGLTGKVESSYSLRLDANGYWVGWQFLNDGSTGSVQFRADNFIIAAPDNYKSVQFRDGVLISQSPTHSYYHGAGFGEDEQFITWFGPTPTEDFQGATRDNGVFFITTEGAPYFGGELSNDQVGKLPIVVDHGDRLDQVETDLGELGDRWAAEEAARLAEDARIAQEAAQALADEAAALAATMASNQATLLAEVESRADEMEDQIQQARDDLNSEIDTRTTALQQALDDEIARAQQVEGGLDTRITNDIADVRQEQAQAVAAITGTVDGLSAQVADLTQADEHDPNKSYPRNDLVQSGGKLYSAKQDVPVGIAITNTTYWQLIGNYNSVVDALGNTVSRVNVHEVQITGMGEDLDVLGQDLSALESVVAGKASASALTSLTTRVTEAEDEIDSLSQSLTALESEVDGKASQGAVNSLESRVTDAEDLLETHGSSLTLLEGQLEGKASSSALNALTTRVTSAEGNITALTQDLSDLSSTVDGKADGSALSALTTRVTEAEDELESLSQDLTALGSTVANKADAAAVQALTTRVTDAEGELSSLTSSLTDLSGRLTDAEGNITAQGDAVSALTVRVTENEQGIESVASQTDLLRVSLGDVKIDSGVPTFRQPDEPQITGVRRNLLLQTDVGGDLWSVNGAVEIESGVADPLGGRNAIRISSPDGASSGGKYAFGANRVPLLEGETYTFSGWMRVTNGTGRGRFGCEKYVPPVTDLTDQWIRVVQTFVAEEGKISTVIAYRNSSGEHEFFGPQLELGNAPTPYQAVRSDTDFDGSGLPVGSIWHQTNENDEVISTYRYNGAGWDSVADSSKASVSALDDTNLRVTETEDGIEALGQDLQQITATLDGKADAEAMQLIASRVTEVEDGLESATSSITSLESQIGGLGGEIDGLEDSVAANASAISGLTTDVTNLGGDIASLSSSVTTLENTIGDPATGLNSKASSSALNGLTSYVNELGEDVSSLSSSVTSLKNTIEHPSTGLNSKASSSAVAALDSRVSAVEASASDVTALEARLGTVEGSLIQEMITSAQKDAVHTSSINLIEARLDDPDTGLEASATGVSGLKSRVTTVEDKTAAHTSQLTTLQAQVNALDLDAGGSGQAIADLTTRVEEVEDGIESHGQAITALQNSVTSANKVYVQDAQPSTTGQTHGNLWIDSNDNNKLYAFNSATNKWELRQDSGKNTIFVQGTQPTARAVNDLWFDTSRNNRQFRWNGSSWVEVTDTRVSSNATAISSLTTRVGNVEGVNETQSQQITTLTNRIDDSSTGLAANASAISGLSSRVTSAEGTISSHTSDITALENKVNHSTSGNSALASNLSSLTSRVTSAEGTLSSHTSSINSLNSKVNHSTTGLAATASNVSALTTRVSTAEGKISSHASSINTLSTTVGNHTTTITSHTSSINGLQGKAGVTINSNGYITGWALNNNGKSGTFTVQADRFRIVAPGGGARTEFSNGNWRVYDSNGRLRVRLGIW